MSSAHGRKSRAVGRERSADSVAKWHAHYINKWRRSKALRTLCKRKAHSCAHAGTLTGSPHQPPTANPVVRVQSKMAHVVASATADALHILPTAASFVDPTRLGAGVGGIGWTALLFPALLLLALALVARELAPRSECRGWSGNGTPRSTSGVVSPTPPQPAMRCACH